MIQCLFFRDRRWGDDRRFLNSTSYVLFLSVLCQMQYIDILAVKSKVDIHLRHIHHLNFPFAISDNPSHKNFNQLGGVGVAPGSQNWIQHSCKLIKLKATKLSIGAKWTSTRITYQSVLAPILSISWKSDNLQNHSCYFQKCISN